MDSIIGVWRVSARRTLADWPVVAAAWLIMLLASVVFAAGAIYPSAASEAGLRRALADAPPSDVQVDVSRYGSPTDASAVDARVEAELARAISVVGGTVVRDWRVTPTFGLGGRSDSQDRAILGVLDGLPDHATLIAGAWPADDGGSPGGSASGGTASGELQVAALDSVARDLGLGVGAELSLASDVAGVPATIPARLVGIFSIKAVDDPYWTGDPQLLTGVQASGANRFFGPFVSTQGALLSHVGSASIHLRWRAFPASQQVRVDDVPQLAGAVANLPDRLAAVTGETFQMATGLPTILGDAERSLLVSRTGVLLLMAQLAILAAYAIVLTALLLVDHRRVETSLLRSRGAGPSHIAVLALAEGLVLAVPAILAAPWLAVGALDVLNVVGPLADVQLHIDPRVSVEAYLVAGVGALACVALLVLPAALAARNFAAEQGGLSRAETRPFGQRLGLDAALLAVTGIGLWQLRLYGAPLTRTVQGSLGLDPLLVAAPTISLVAGAVLALRVLPLAAHAVERAVSRAPGLVASLGSRELARRPLRYTRSALLLMLAMSMGAFATCYAATWTGSQRDQAAYQAGADVRVVPSQSAQELPAWALAHAYAGLPAIRAATPIERIPNGASLGFASSADLLALDAATAAGLVRFRADESARSLADLLRPLRDGRPELDLATFAAGSGFVRVVPRFDVSAGSRVVVDPATGEETVEQIDPRTFRDARLAVSVIVRDARGLLYRVTSDLVPMAGSGTAITLPLHPVSPGVAVTSLPPDAALEGPLQLAGLSLEVWLPDRVTVTDGVVGVAALSTSADAAGPWTAVPLASGSGWAVKMAQGYQVPEDAPSSAVVGSAVRISNDWPPSILLGAGSAGRAAALSLTPLSVAALNRPVPVIANAAFLTALGAAPGATLIATIEGRVWSLAVTGVVDSFPTTDPSRPLLILDEATLGLLRLQGTSDVRSADEWWLATVPGTADALATTLRGGPFNTTTVVTADERARSLSTDPVALGILGTLALGFVATGLFAAVGLTVSAGVAARQRRTEFALLRALGLSGRQLSGSLWLENGSIVVASLVGGTGLGLLIGWLVLPFVTVTQRATSPLPPIIVEVPWDRILVLDAATAVALGLAVIVIGSALRRLGVGSVLRMGED